MKAKYAALHSVLKNKKMRTLFYATLYVFCSFFVLISLIIFNPNRPSWFLVTTNNNGQSSIIDYCCTNCAAFLFFFIGSAALWLIPYFLFMAYIIFNNYRWQKELDRLSAFFIVIIISASLGAWYKVKLFSTHFAPGGLLGTALVRWCAVRIDPLVLALALHILLLISFLLLTRMSFIAFSSYIVAGLRFGKPAFKWLCARVRWCMHQLYKGFHFVRTLITGTIIDDRKMMEFEFNAMMEELRAITHDDAVMKEQKKEQPEKRASIQSEEINQQTINNESKSDTDASVVSTTYTLPIIDHIFISTPESAPHHNQHNEQLALILKQKLERFGIYGSIVSIKTGPVITLFEYQPHIDSKISKIVALEDDLALALQATSIRIIAPIPGKSVVGFEVAHKHRSSVLFSTLVRSSEFKQCQGILPLILGVDTIGNNVIVDLAAMPHLLIAGATGSGKSVGLNAMLMSLLCKKTCDELKFILIDPKRLEFSSYVDIPHLLFPIITQAKEAIPILKWLVETMEKRYELLSCVGVRNIADYHKVRSNNPDEYEPLPYIVLVIDELADLMMVAGREVEEYIARIAQMARAAGIHMIVATQRPSVDVITGTIKVNFPTRISFRVVSKIDSRTILDCSGAEKLLGKGDMLYTDVAHPMQRVHGAYVLDNEITLMTNHVRKQQKVVYETVQNSTIGNEQIAEQDQVLYAEIIAYLKTVDDISISLLQRRFRIGYNRAARIIEMLEMQGLIISCDGGKTRKVIH